MSKLQIHDHGPIREIRLHRPEVHNAFDPELIDLLQQAFSNIAREAQSNRELRGVLLSGAGKSFCAGADLGYMSSIAGFGEAENIADAKRLSAMLRAIRDCPVYVVARVQGAALGGGAGLLAACNLALASHDAVFGFTEVRLGILPAVISPFVLERIGSAHARALFPTGARFGAAEALRMGLVDQVAAPGELDDMVVKTLRTLLAAAPAAAREANSLIETVATHRPGDGHDAIHEKTAGWIARLRASSEGQEGMRAFFEKRPAGWVRDLPETLPPPADQN